jgi:hypothetical protein
MTRVAYESPEWRSIVFANSGKYLVKGSTDATICSDHNALTKADPTSSLLSFGIVRTSTPAISGISFDPAICELSLTVQPDAVSADLMLSAKVFAASVPASIASGYHVRSACSPANGASLNAIEAFCFGSSSRHAILALIRSVSSRASAASFRAYPASCLIMRFAYSIAGGFGALFRRRIRCM